MSDASKKKAKQRVGYRETKTQQCQTSGLFFIETNDEEFKLTMKAARRKLEVPMPAAVPCKIPIKSSGETHRNIGKRRTKYACIVDADESTRQKARRSCSQTSSRSHHCNRDEFKNSLQSCSQIRSGASSIKNSRCKGGSGGKNGKNLRKSRMAADESQKQERSDR